jgi:hypothetical protein
VKRGTLLVAHLEAESPFAPFRSLLVISDRDCSGLGDSDDAREDASLPTFSSSVYVTLLFVRSFFCCKTRSTVRGFAADEDAASVEVIVEVAEL